MTAYLQRGDKIHLAAPIDKGLNDDKALSETKRLLEFYQTEYGAFGVTITVFSVNSDLHCPAVVAVFRAPDLKEIT